MAIPVICAGCLLDEHVSDDDFSSSCAIPQAEE